MVCCDANAHPNFLCLQLANPLSTNSHSLTSLLGPSADPVEAGVTIREISENESSDGVRLIAELAEHTAVLSQSDPAIVGGLMRLIHTLVLRQSSEAVAAIEPSVVATIVAALPPAAPNRFLALHLLASLRHRRAIETLVELLKSFPPKDWIEAGQILSPLMQNDDWPVDAFFPAAFDCLAQPALASPILDLASYLTRSDRVDPHPASDYVDMLTVLLGEVSSRLGKFEEDPQSFGTEVEQVQQRLGEAVALAVSLCDSLGLIGDKSCIGKLNQTLELKHRRVQCEAAGSLARLGDNLGRNRLVKLAEEPAARLRAIHYADEMEFGDLIDDQYRSDQATAEAEMALWLTQPQQMGVPPTDIEVLDSRHIMWPGFSDPIDVFLIRFEYNFGDRRYSNVGITGPISFALAADVADLPADDIYAIYAGWHAEHPEIFTVPKNQFNEAQRRMIEPLQIDLDRHGFDSLNPQLLGVFLDEYAAVFTAVREGTECVVVTDGLEFIHLPTAGRPRAVTPGDLFNLYKGRKMLRTFNPNGIDSTADDE